MQRYGGRRRRRRPSKALDSATGGRFGSADEAQVSRDLELPKAISVKQLADEMAIDPVEVIKELIRSGVMANINQVIDYDIAANVAVALGYTATPLPEAEEEFHVYSELSKEDDPAKMVARPPVVTILGHVDHGKTTLLDAIRQSNLTDGEVGGITQRIGAYQVEYNGEKITFLDTPGHEAFTSMRSRGAKATDIAVLVVAADDGVMPQTVEAIDHAKAAGVPIVVAINKTDMPNADMDRVKRQLVERGLVIEEWGGDVIAIPISAKEHQGIDDLLENILVVAEVSELKADPERPAIGVIVEAQVDKSRGPVATVLVQTGTLRMGQTVVVGNSWGRIKALMDESGQRVSAAEPSAPATILGLGQLPQAGETLWTVASEKVAKELIHQRQLRLDKERQVLTATTLEDASARIGTGEITDLNLIVKTDVQGTVDAVRGTLEKLATDKGKVNIIHLATGSINESDVLLAGASKAIIIGFNTRVEPGARHMADSDKIDIRIYDIIYRLSEDIQSALEGLLKPEQREVVEGHSEVRAIFSLGRRIKIAGAYVTDGRISRNAIARVLRNGELLHQSTISSLKHFKDDVREMATGFECGIGVNGFNDFQLGDIIEAVRLEQTS
ncbi:translation initiation factor IF-2 [SAR202 cluster bacterium AC-647-N09_OGT_505m]|nr:translation initiation factor IF-2 [SAR202 cluster bacterium AC-647-N09_OGT_505m]